MFGCEPTKNLSLESSDQISKFQASKSINDFTSVGIQHKDVLAVSPHTYRITNKIVEVFAENIKGHSMFGADAIGLFVCGVNHSGNIIIADPIPARIEGFRAILRLAEVCQDYDIWKTFAGSSFPNADQFIGTLIKPTNFNTLLDNIYQKKIIFVNRDLSKTIAHQDIINYLINETGYSTIAVIDATCYENDINSTVFVNEHFFSVENFSFERNVFLEQRQLAIESIQQHMKANIKALMNEKTILVQSNNNEIQLLDKLQVDIKLHAGVDVPLELISIESMFGETFSNTYHMAHDLHKSFHELIALHSNEITTNHIPVLDTLVQRNDTYDLTFVNAKNFKEPAVTIKNIKAPIFKRVSNFIKNISINHITTVGSTSMNLYFGIRAMCHWIEHGFTADTEGISNKNLATAMEVHFYVNAIGLVQGLVETAVAGGQFAITQGLKSAMLIPAIKPYIQLSITLLKMSSGGRILISFGRFASKALPIIGLIINATDLALNGSELYLNEDPYQRPILITNTVFSALGLTVSVATVVAVVAGASTLLGPLAVVGLGIALLAMPITYLVGLFTAAIEGAKNVGLCIEHIVNEIECGGYKIDNENHLLAAPSLVPIKQVTLKSSVLEVTLNRFKYLPTNDQTTNQFNHWYHISDKYARGSDSAVIPIDERIRTLILPHTPICDMWISWEHVPFSARREDAEFRMARDLQKKDAGFTFQRNDYIGSKMSFSYEDTEINVNIVESNWRLICPWIDPSTDSDNKEQVKRSNEDVSRRLQYITYKVTSTCDGRQSIQLPGNDCNVNLHLDASNVDAIWFIDCFDNFISDEHLTISKDQIKIGANQTIKIDGDKSKVYLTIPNYSANNATAYFDPIENIYIYNKKWTKNDQKNVILLFATKTYAYFYKHNEQSDSHTASSIWAVCNETNETVIEYHDVKLCQRQGDGLFIITTQGIIFFMSEDVRNRKLVSQIIGFNVDWFKQANALKLANDRLNKIPHSPMVHFHLPYYQNEFNASTADLLFDVEKQKYLIVGARYAVQNQPEFLMYDHSGQCGLFYAKNQKELIAVNGLNIDEISEKIQGGHIQVSANGPSEKIFVGLLAASIAETGIKARLSAGLEVILKLAPKSTHMILEVQKLILNNLSNESDKRTSIALQEALDKLRKENLGDANKFEIICPAFIAIEYNGQNIGFYEKNQERTLCAIDIPRAKNLIPLGTDADFAYHIVNHNEIHRTKYLTHLSELRNRLESKRKSKNNQINIWWKVDAITLFNRTIFLKHENVSENILKTICKLPEIDFVWIESKKYRLNLDNYENIAISCMNLSQMDTETNIEFHVHNLDDYHFERQNVDLFLHNSSRKFTLIFKGAFESATVTQSACISLKIQDSNIIGLDMPSTFKLSTLIDRPIRAFNSPIGLVEALQNIPASPETIERMFVQIFWPDDQKQQIYDLFHYINENGDKAKSQYLSGCLNNYPNIMGKVMQQENRMDSILHLSIKDGQPSVIQAFFKLMDGKPEILNEFVLNTNQEDKTALHCSAESTDTEAVRIFLDEVRKYVSNDTLKKLVLKSGENGYNAVHYATRNKNANLINVLIEAVNKYLNNTVLYELLIKSDRHGNTPLHFAAIYDDAKTMKVLLTAMKNHLTVETRKEIILKENKKGSTALNILANKDHTKSMVILYDETNELFGREPTVLNDNKNGTPKKEPFNLVTCASNGDNLKSIFVEKKKNHKKDELKKMIFEKNTDQQMAIHIFISNDQSECIRVLCTEVKNMFGKKTLKNMLEAPESETDPDEYVGNALEFAVGRNKFNSFKMLVEQMKKHLGNDTLNKFMQSFSVFHYLIQCEHTEFFQQYLEEIQKSMDKNTLNDLIFKVDDLSQTLLDVLFFTNQIEHIWSVQSAITKCLDKDIFNKLLLTVSPLNRQNVLHLIISHADCEMLRTFWTNAKENVDLETLQKLIIMIDSFQRTAVHYLINFKSECESSFDFLKDIIELLSHEKLIDLVAPTDRANMLQHFASHDSWKMFTTFWMEIKLKLGIGEIGEIPFRDLLARNLSDVIGKLMQDIHELYGENTLNDQVSLNIHDGENMLFYCANRSNAKTFKIFWMAIKKYLTREHFRQLLLHRNHSSQTILHILIVKDRSELIQILLNELHEFGEDALIDVMQATKTQSVLELVAIHESNEIFKIIWNGIKAFLTKSTAKKLILRTYNVGNTLTHILASKNKFENILTLLRGINEHFGKKTLEAVTLNSNSMGENALQVALSNDSFETIETLFDVANEYLGKPVLMKMITNTNMNGKNAFQHAYIYCSENAFQKILELAKKYVEVSVIDKLSSKGLIYG